MAALAFDSTGEALAALLPCIPCVLVWQLVAPWTTRWLAPLAPSQPSRQEPLILQPVACCVITTHPPARSPAATQGPEPAVGTSQRLGLGLGGDGGGGAPASNAPAGSGGHLSNAAGGAHGRPPGSRALVEFRAELHALSQPQAGGSPSQRGTAPATVSKAFGVRWAGPGTVEVSHNGVAVTRLQVL